MMQFTGRWENLEALDSESLLNDVRPSGPLAMKKALVAFEGIIKKTLTGKRSGRSYKVSKTGRLHVASAPGEPPAVMFGNLRNSVGHSGPKVSKYVLEGEVGVGLGQAPSGDAPDPAKSYGRRMELGGADARGVYIAPRPYMAPSADKAEPVITRIFDRELGPR